MGINDAINAIILALNAIFGDEYTYYAKNVGQGMKLPCLFVQYIDGSENLLVGNRYESQSHFVIHAHIEDSFNKNNELNDIVTKLYELEYITLANGDLIRLENRNSKVEDNDILFYIDLNVHLLKNPKEEIKMQNINIEERVKNNE